MRLTPLLISIGIGLFHAARASACDTALLLTIDVSNSVDTAEYRLQVDGMADALIDGEIADAMIQGEVAIAVMQWSGVDRQELSIPWTRIAGQADVDRLSATARSMPRAFILSDTAPAEAIQAALAQFGAVPDCARRIIDISGDGTANAGSYVRLARNRAETMGVTINGIAIESMGLSVTTFFRAGVITRDGFVITARTHRDYPSAIRTKILREVARVLG